MEPLYRKVEIKSEQDLPKETAVGSTDFYFVGCGNQKDVAYYSYTDKCWYNHEFAEIFDPEYYIDFQPIEPQESKEHVFLIHQDGNTARLYKDGVKVSPEEFTTFYGCEMTPEQKELLQITKKNYFESIQPEGIREKMVKLLNWIDKSTYWKEDNDIPTEFIVDEYLKSKQP